MGSYDPIDDRRQARRFRAQHLAKIVVESDVMITCMVEDISTGGAKISLHGRHHVPDEFDLYIAAHELQVHRAQLRWRQDGMLGVAFLKPADQPRALTKDEDERFRVEAEWTGKLSTRRRRVFR